MAGLTPNNELNKVETDTLVFYLSWMESHVDEKGIQKPPGKFLVKTLGLSTGVRQLYSKGYLRYGGQSDTLYPTARALAWWIRRKYDSVRPRNVQDTR